MIETETPFVATREEALRRLQAFVPRAGRAYAATRNEDRGPSDRRNVSTLSPYVRHRLVTEEEILRAVLACETRTAAFKFVQETFWRTYWKGWLESRPQVWDDYLAAVSSQTEALASDRDARARYERAVSAATGIAPFDAWVRELRETGYLHNHARMWFASIWLFTLRLPWELGADLFMRELCCGDPASNTLSWRWVAGLHTRGKTYLARASNIARYTLNRFPPATGLASSAPSLAGPAYPAVPLPDLTAYATSDDAPTLLVMHDDDLGVETFAISRERVRATLAFDSARLRSPGAISGNAATFARDSVTDALARAAGDRRERIDPVADLERAVDAIATVAAETGATTVAMPYAPVGPNRPVVAALGERLAARGIAHRTFVRPYDASSWPHATRGFFNLGHAIPSILDRLGIDAGATEPPALALPL